MENQVNISEELTSISPAVAAIERKNTYTVPENYFDQLSESIMLLVQDDPQLSMSPSVETYSVPEGYFETFASSVLSKIQEESSASHEIETLSPLLASLQSKETYKVPAGYFEQLGFDIPKERTAAKVVAMQPRKTNWTRYAVAASVATILGLTGFFTFKEGKSSQEIVAGAGGSVEQTIISVPDDELEAYLFNASERASNDDKIRVVQSTLSTIEDEDIKDYLKENSDPIESPFQGI